MSDEAAVPLEERPVEETKIVKPAEHEPEDHQEKKPTPEGWEQVDLSELPPEIADKYEKRLNRLYGQMKRSEGAMKEMAENQRRLYDRLDNWEAGQAQQRTAGRLTELEREFKQAFEKGDSEKAWRIQRELAELNVPQKPVTKTEEPAPKAALPQDEASAIADWASERPYAQDGNKWQQWTAAQLNELYVDPDWMDKPIDDKLEEVDRRYRSRTKPRSAEVLDGQGGAAKANRTPKLSDEQKAVARMLFADMKPNDAYARYAKGMG